MPDMLEGQFVSPETSSDGPALAVLNDTLYVAWVGSGNNHLNIMPSIWRNDRVEFDSARKVTLGDDVTSLGGPALCASRGELLLAWTHDGGSSGGAPSLFGRYFSGSLDAGDFVASLETSDAGPAVVGWDHVNGVNIAWRGSGNPQLNVMPGLTSNEPFTSPETSPYRPSLCVSWFLDSLVVAWTGEGDGQLNYMTCQNDAVYQFNHKVNFPDETSESAPGTAALGRAVYVSWRGRGNDEINLLARNYDDGNQIKRISSQTSPHTPAIAAYQNRIFVAWTGQDEAINLASATAFYDPNA